LPEVFPGQAVTTGPDATYLQLGLGRGASYLDLDLEIGQGHQGVYPLLVLRSPVGAATGQLRWPFAGAEFQQTLLELQNALLRASQPHRQALSPEAQTVQRFGQRLFEALFVGEVRQRYTLSQQEAAQHGCGLRLRLHLLAPDLAVVPWEYLYDPEQGDYLCLSRTTPIVRYLERPQARQPLPVTFPLRILGMTASPGDQEALDTASEQRRVEAALHRLRERGLVELIWLKGHTWRALQQAMRGGPWHIVHFIGHGGFDRQADEGVLALEDEEGKTHLLRATEVARLLATQQALRLVLLNACEGARASKEDRFSSTAATLARRDIPAILAMQYAISDRAATEWTRAFYEAIADGLPVDAAVAEARTALSLAVPRSLEWGTPVLYLQAPDGVLFRLPEPSRSLPVLPGEQGLPEAEASERAGRPQETRAPTAPGAAQGTAAVLPALEAVIPSALTDGPAVAASAAQPRPEEAGQRGEDSLSVAPAPMSSPTHPAGTGSSPEVVPPPPAAHPFATPPSVPDQPDAKAPTAPGTLPRPARRASPPARHWRRSRGQVILLVILTVLLIGGGTLFYASLAQNQATAAANASNTATANAEANAQATAAANVFATATTQAQATASVIQTATSGFPVYFDPLLDGDSTDPTWTNHGTNCFFTSDGYHIHVEPPAQGNAGQVCLESDRSFQDATISVDMVLHEGYSGGLLFRLNNNQGYLFEVGIGAGYHIALWGAPGTLKDWTDAPVIHAGLLRSNTLEVIVRGSMFLFYVNGFFLTAVQDTTYGVGTIGLASFGSNTTGPGDAVFSNLKVYSTP
jgi:CHAT domain-containing protein